MEEQDEAVVQAKLDIVVRIQLGLDQVRARHLPRWCCRADTDMQSATSIKPPLQQARSTLPLGTRTTWKKRSRHRSESVAMRAYAATMRPTARSSGSGSCVAVPSTRTTSASIAATTGAPIGARLMMYRISQSYEAFQKERGGGGGR